ncbi:MAG: hypothetical protein ACM3MN_09925 [Nitrospirota bacterium]
MVFPYHLCQPDNQKSCAGCCGIYNYRDSSRAGLERRLRRHTSCLGPPRPLDAAAFRSYARRFRPRENGWAKLFATIYNCEFVGFLDRSDTRVGCLLHPSQRHGDDWRRLSFHGGSLCAGHFCLSYSYLTRQEQETVILGVDDWYLYGLVITDIDLVKTYCRHLNDRLGYTFDARLIEHPLLKEVVHRFFGLKINWPFRAPEPDRFGKYRFADESYQEAFIDYERFGLRGSPYDAIFRSLGSGFAAGDEVRDAQRLIDSHLERFLTTYESLPLRS